MAARILVPPGYRLRHDRGSMKGRTLKIIRFEHLSFLLAMGIGGAVHLLAILCQALRRGDDKAAAISYALSHSGLG
jgi:hypothetical protein